jgi:hypothetical protein
VTLPRPLQHTHLPAPEQATVKGIEHRSLDELSLPLRHRYGTRHRLIAGPSLQQFCRSFARHRPHLFFIPPSLANRSQSLTWSDSFESHCETLGSIIA